MEVHGTAHIASCSFSGIVVSLRVKGEADDEYTFEKSVEEALHFPLPVSLLRTHELSPQRFFWDTEVERYPILKDPLVGERSLLFLSPTLLTLRRKSLRSCAPLKDLFCKEGSSVSGYVKGWRIGDGRWERPPRRGFYEWRVGGRQAWV